MVVNQPDSLRISQRRFINDVRSQHDLICAPGAVDLAWIVRDLDQAGVRAHQSLGNEFKGGTSCLKDHLFSQDAVVIGGMANGRNGRG